MKRVVVTGLGAVTPIGNNTKGYLEGLQHGTSGANLITRFDATNFKTHFACEVKDFNPDELMDKKEARKMDLFSQFAMQLPMKLLQMLGLTNSWKILTWIVLVSFGVQVSEVCNLLKKK